MFKGKSPKTDADVKKTEKQNAEKEQRIPAGKNSPKLLKAYANQREHLIDELRWLNMLLYAHTVQLRDVKFYNNLKSFDFFISDEEIDALFADGVFEKRGNEKNGEALSNLSKMNDEWRQHIKGRLELSVEQNIELPLLQLARWFHLRDFELQILVICLAITLDGRYEKLYAYLQNDLTKRLPSIDLILDLLCPKIGDRWHNYQFFHPSGALYHFHLIDPVPQEFFAPPAQQFLSVNPRVMGFILGDHRVDFRIVRDFHFLQPLALNMVVVDGELKIRLQKLLKQNLSNIPEKKSTYYFYGQKDVGKKLLAQALCSDVGIPLASVDMRNLLSEANQFHNKIRLIFREGWLSTCAICLDHLEQLENHSQEQPFLYKILIEVIQEMGWITFLCSEKPVPLELLKLSNVCAVEIPRPAERMQQTLWKKHLAAAKVECGSFDLGQLTLRFDLNGGQIAEAIHLGKQNALLKNPDEPQLSAADLFDSCRFVSQPKLSKLARKVSPKYTWKHLVLPDDQLQQLKELVLQVKHRKIVMSDWGFAKKLSLGRGVNALFSGPSGTGKTMSAEIIANDLRLDLYKVDLSAVVSKYIGETEKNLNRIFNEAEYSNSILFFDEADALLGKRSEVKDAHDRYANIEVAYLLQKMEEYEGITILATNLRQNIDEAFVRRIRFIIEFPFPEQAYRERIWGGIWPKGTPLSGDIDRKFLARQFRLTGGNIRNIALTAAYYAAENGRIVTMAHLIKATKREFQKMGRICGKGEFGEYYSLVQDA